MVAIACFDQCPMTLCRERLRKGEAQAIEVRGFPPITLTFNRQLFQLHRLSLEMPSLYSTKAWKQLRKAQLQAMPFCVFCLRLGIRSPATVADHITPHKGNKDLFFDPCNLQSLCKTCHDSAKQHLEQSGVLKGCDAAGFPLDPNHHWNRA